MKFIPLKTESPSRHFVEIEKVIRKPVLKWKILRVAKITLKKDKFQVGTHTKFKARYKVQKPNQSGID